MIAQNVLYLDHRERCHCGGFRYCSAVYLEQSNTTEWHIMIEQKCTTCSALDLTDIPLDDAIQLAEDLAEAQTIDDAERAEAEERGIPDFDDMGFMRGHVPPSRPEDV